jgi:hypothetical protein
VADGQVGQTVHHGGNVATVHVIHHRQSRTAQLHAFVRHVLVDGEPQEAVPDGCNDARFRTALDIVLGHLCVFCGRDQRVRDDPSLGWLVAYVYDTEHGHL